MSSTDSFMLMQSSATPVLVVWCLSSDENRVLQFLTSPVASKAKSVFGLRQLRHQPSTPNPNLLSGVVFGGLGTRLDNIFVNLVHQYKCKKCIAMYCKQTTFLVIIPFLFTSVFHFQGEKNIFSKKCPIDPRKCFKGIKSEMVFWHN